MTDVGTSEGAAGAALRLGEPPTPESRALGPLEAEIELGDDSSIEPMGKGTVERIPLGRDPPLVTRCAGPFLP